jgi:hypothetical protein
MNNKLDKNNKETNKMIVVKELRQWVMFTILMGIIF